jgi:hypothetical protein
MLNRTQGKKRRSRKAKGSAEHRKLMRSFRNVERALAGARGARVYRVNLNSDEKVDLVLALSVSGRIGYHGLDDAHALAARIWGEKAAKDSVWLKSLFFPAAAPAPEAALSPEPASSHESSSAIQERAHAAHA